MCGICGKIYFDSSRICNQAEIAGMSDKLSHRGPNDEGFYIHQNVGLGFRRLSIIDLETGHQPLSNEDGNIWIAFNGEIYNFLELKQNLIQKGHVFRTNSDTEVVVHLYEEFGFDCLEHLRGMFSFSIWDNNKKLLFCARDRFGKKPFYYSFDDNAFIWASEIKAILPNKEVKRTINYNALDQYFSYGYIDDACSIYNSINKLPAAHYLILKPLNRSDKLEIKSYWKIEFEPDHTKSEKYWIEEFNRIFSESVKLRLISDVPLGAFLSGGIDSSSVVSMMSQHQTQVKTFSIGFEEETFNELPYAREIVQRYQTDHRELIIKPDCIHILPELIKTFDEPFADSSAIPTFYVTKFAAEHVTVALSGDGGDELFAGYSNYPQFLSYAHKNILPKPFKLLSKYLAGNLPDSIKGKKMLNYLSVKKNYEYAYASIWQNYERKKLYNRSTNTSIQFPWAESFKEEILNTSLKVNPLLSSLQYCDMLTYLPNDILVKVDRTSMHHSLEVRSPFLDHKLAELSFQIPESIKYKNQDKKYMVKKSMSHLLPSNIINHPKQGFSVPLQKWFQNELYVYLSDKIHSDKNIDQFFNKDYLIKILEFHKKGYRDYGSKLWSVLFFMEWFDYSKSSK